MMLIYVMSRTVSITTADCWSYFHCRTLRDETVNYDSETRPQETRDIVLWHEPIRRDSRV